jgi:hypothetical protein
MTLVAVSFAFALAGIAKSSQVGSRVGTNLDPFLPKTMIRQIRQVPGKASILQTYISLDQAALDYAQLEGKAQTIDSSNLAPTTNTRRTIYPI